MNERALTGADLASVVEACQTLKLHTSMSDGAKLVEEVRRAVERGVDAFDWQAVGRLDVAIEGVVGEKIEGELRRKLNARGVAACAEAASLSAVICALSASSPENASIARKRSLNHKTTGRS